jgi:hypothetical protein
LVNPDDYHLSPTYLDLENYPYFLHLNSACRQRHNWEILKVVYFAGYKTFEVPPDLKKACLELAAWNYKQHKNISNEKYDGSMPQSVRELLEPYRRKII